MLTTIANQLKPSDEFTTDEGLTWHTVHTRLIVRTNNGEVVLVMTEDYQKIWLWANEEIVVRI